MAVQNYHRHTHYSNPSTPDSVVTNEDYCKRAKEVGASIISSCEHGTQGNYWECSELAEKYGLHWRYVTEAYFVKNRKEKDNTNCHMILAAKTKKGIGDLNHALSEANISGFYYHPRIDMELLMDLDSKDVFVTTACVAGIWKYGNEEAEKLVKMMHDHFGESMMLEVQYHNTDKQKDLNRFILSLYRKYGIPLIMGMDSHYIYEEDAWMRDMFIESKHINYPDEEGWYLDYPDEETAYKRFKEQGVLSDIQIKEAMENTNIFLTFEDVTLGKEKKLPTLYPELTQEERNQKYTELVYSKWDEYKVNVPPEQWPKYLDGIQYEVNTITSTNMSDYFLLDYHLVKRGRELGGMLTKTGRGSGPSYFTNTLLGFSSIDRFALPVTMYPDRFISADRIKSGSLPDLDLNIADQEPFAKAQNELLGKWNAAPMIAFGTMKRLSAWKMYCRAEKVEFDTANEISSFLKKYETDYKYADDEEKNDLDVHDYVPEEYWDVVDKSEKYLGIIDNISPHPCAFLLCQKDIRREIGIYCIHSKTGSKKVIYAAYIDGATAERFGYLKNDLLKVDVVKVNANAYKRIGIEQPSVSELGKLVKNDTATWDLYAKGYTMGLNQVEREKSKEKVMRYKPRNISELSAFVAGIRPAFQSMVNKLLDREHFDYGVPALDRLLQTPEMPNSFVLYQEQMMMVLQYAGFSSPESYSAIKAIAKKHPEKVLPLRERFLDGFRNKMVVDEHVDESLAKATSDKVWQIVTDACSYNFNSCLTGDTKMFRMHGGTTGYQPTIGEMYLIKNSWSYAKKTCHMPLHKKYKEYGYGAALSLSKDGRVYKNHIVDIRDQGVRDTYLVRTESGKEVKCTDNHKFPIGSYDNLIKLSDIHVGDELFIKGGYEKNKISHCLTKQGVKNLPYKGQIGFQKSTDGGYARFHSYRQNCVDEGKSCEGCGVTYSEDQHFELHHIDGDSTHNEPSNYAWLCNSCHKKAHYRLLNRRGQYQKGYPSYKEKIVSIEYIGKQHVYDVEMADPYHNFALDNGIITGNSHAVSVAFDSLYSAYAKAHYPMDFYAALLTNYAEKKDKDRSGKAKSEMKKAFGITIVPCEFGQDNRDYYLDRKNRKISNALASIKSISQKTAETLYQMKDEFYPTFVDLLYDSEYKSALDKGKIEALIKVGYFHCFGGRKKLLTVLKEFKEGESKFSKIHIQKTQEARLDTLRNFEESLPDEDYDVTEIMKMEQEYYGCPMSVFPDYHKHFTVIEVDDKYSPKLKLYNVSTGTMGTMKVKKALYKRYPVKEGNTIFMESWARKPAYMYKDGVRTILKNKTDLWINSYYPVSEEESEEAKEAGNSI